MAVNLIVVLAASGLVAAGAPNVAQNRAADAMPAVKAAMVQSAPAKGVGPACFVPVKAGKALSIANFRKAKASGSCADAQLAGAAGGSGSLGTGGKVALGVGVAAEAAIIGVGLSCNSSVSPC
jgi:hypothetical protein